MESAEILKDNESSQSNQKEDIHSISNGDKNEVNSLNGPPIGLVSCNVPHQLKKRVRNEFYRIRQNKRVKRTDLVRVSPSIRQLAY